MTELNTFEIQPAGELIVRDPLTARPLTAKGESKPRNKFWLRRLADGDVIELDKPDTKTKSTKASPKRGAVKTNNEGAQ